MSKLTDYQKPELKEYSHFGIVAEGGSGPGGDQDPTVCNAPGVDGFED